MTSQECKMEICSLKSTEEEPTLDDGNKSGSELENPLLEDKSESESEDECGGSKPGSNNDSSSSESEHGSTVTSDAATADHQESPESPTPSLASPVKSADTAVQTSADVPRDEEMPEAERVTEETVSEKEVISQEQNEAKIKPEKKQLLGEKSSSEQIHIPSDKSTLTQVSSKLEFKYAFKWVIQSFSQYMSAKSGEYLQSPVFHTGYGEEIGWRLMLYPNGLNWESHNSCVYLFLKSESGLTEHDVTVKCTVSILDNKEKNIHSKTWDFNYKHSGFRGRILIKKDMLMDDSKKLLPNDKLTILFGMQIDFEQASPAKLCLYADFRTLLGNEKFSDCLLNVDGIKIKVHKCILAARSLYFRALLDSDSESEGNEQNEIYIGDISHDLLMEILRYIYTGTVLDDSYELLSRLLAVVDKYEVNGLMNFCELGLINLITVDNSLKVLELANSYNAVKLHSKTLDFIDKNLKGVVDGEFFERREDLKRKGDLLVDIIRKIARRE